MIRSIRSTVVALALPAAMLFALATQAQRDFSNVEIIAHHVAGNMYYLQGSGGNIGLSIGEDGVVMVDDQFAPLTERIAALGMLVGRAGPDTLIVPGHGGVSSRADVMEFRDMIIETANAVESMIGQGMDYDEVAAADPTAAWNDRYGDPERFLSAVYSELGGQ